MKPMVIKIGFIIDMTAVAFLNISRIMNNSQ